MTTAPDAPDLGEGEPLHDDEHPPSELLELYEVLAWEGRPPEAEA